MLGGQGVRGWISAAGADRLAARSAARRLQLLLDAAERALQLFVVRIRRLVKQVAQLGGDISSFVPECVHDEIIERLRKE